MSSDELGELPDQPVLVVTQTANHRARRLAARLGFQEAPRLRGARRAADPRRRLAGSFQASLARGRPAPRLLRFAVAEVPGCSPRPADALRHFDNEAPDGGPDG